MTDTPIFDQLTADAVEWSAAASRRARSTASRVRHTVRSVQIEAGVCPPWRTDPTIPVGYDGARFTPLNDDPMLVVRGLPPMPDPARLPGETDHERFHRASLLPVPSPLCVRCTS